MELMKSVCISSKISYKSRSRSNPIYYDGLTKSREQGYSEIASDAKYEPNVFLDDYFVFLMCSFKFNR